jgi:hypothetical protein
MEERILIDTSGVDRRQGVLLSFARMPRSEEWGMNGEESPPKL